MTLLALQTGFGTPFRADERECAGLMSYLQIDLKAGAVSIEEVVELRREHCESQVLQSVATPSQIVRTLLRDVAASPRNRDEGLSSHTLSGVLKNKRGACAPIVAYALLQLEERSDVRASVRQSHVLLWAGGSLHEPLEGGRAIDASKAEQHIPEKAAAGPLDALEFLPYYVENVASRLAAEGETQPAIAFLTELVSQHPDNSRFRYSLGSVLLQVGDTTRADSQLNRAYELGRRTPELLSNLAWVAFDRGEEAAGCERLAEALELDPAFRQARLLYRRCERPSSPQISNPGRP